jgi:hypothetical protein
VFQFAAVQPNSETQLQRSARTVILDVVHAKVQAHSALDVHRQITT